MEVEYIPIFLEKKNGHTNGAWMHADGRINARVMPLAYTSDVGLLRIIVNNLDTAVDVLKRQGLTIMRAVDAVEVMTDGQRGIFDILHILSEQGICTELTGIIPGIYQG